MNNILSLLNILVDIIIFKFSEFILIVLNLFFVKLGNVIIKMICFN